jgi:hypothetical protein
MSRNKGSRISKRIGGAYSLRHALGKGVLLLCGAAALAACGRIGDLQPPPGTALPVKPRLAQTVPTAEELLIPPPYARPERTDEIQSRNRPRTADRFDLPPPDGGAAPSVETDGQAENRTNDAGPASPK